MIKNNKGFTLIEVLVTALIGIVTAAVIASYLQYMANIHDQLKTRRIVASTVRSMAENMRFNLSLYQVSFDNSVDRESEMLNKDSLPLALSFGKLISRSDCSTSGGCQAYLGYQIIPTEFVRNVYQVKFVAVNAAEKKSSWKSVFTYYITVK